MSSSTDRRTDRHRASTPVPPAPRRGWVLLLVGAVALLVGALLGGLLSGSTGGGDVGDGSADAPEPGSIEAVAAELAEGQQQDQAALAGELAEAAETVHHDLEEVLQGLAAVAPVNDGTGEAADAAGAADWAATLEQAHVTLDSTGEGTDDQAVTRAALLGGVELLQVAVERAADGADVAQVSRDRSAAVRLWQAGATRLDSLVIATGGDHIHLFLAEDGDPESVPGEFRDLHEDE